jgi:carboxyl-terminal processing protease
MFQKNRRFLLPALLLLLIGGFLGSRVGEVVGSDDTYEQLRKLEEAFLLIDRQYVEEVTPGQMTDAAIRAMLGELDPHSTYIDVSHVRNVQEEYEGSFGGIGIWFEVPAGDTARVTSTFPDGPSEGVGIMAGDRLVRVGDESIVGAGSLDIQKQLKGPVGTEVSLTVARPGAAAPITFTITRDRIPLFSVDSSYMVDQKTGYLRIGRFSMTTHEEFLEHVGRLKEQGMQQLILDLRGNPGGIKKAAVDIADEMLDGTGTIVFTRGRSPGENEVDPITPGGFLVDEPIIVLVDENSASGSEIVAGALQDQDRALIVGRRTFGKGLVQRPFQLRDGSYLQMTVARYYMPSGRLIQTPYENGDIEAYYKEKFSNYEEATLHPDQYLHDIPDSLKYETVHGRTVYGGGGVMPDVVVAPDSLSPIGSPLFQRVFSQGSAFLFIRDRLTGNASQFESEWKDRKEEFLESYEVDRETWSDFVSYLKKNGFDFSPGQQSAGSKDSAFSSQDLEDAGDGLRTLLKARLAQRLFRSESWWPVFNTIDPTFQSALEMWGSARSLSLLPVSKKETGDGAGQF